MNLRVIICNFECFTSTFKYLLLKGGVYETRSLGFVIIIRV